MGVSHKVLYTLYLWLYGVSSLYSTAMTVGDKAVCIVHLWLSVISFSVEFHYGCR
jgi:hypothetical protein